jgi:hypothetical protein
VIAHSKVATSRPVDHLREIGDGTDPVGDSEPPGLGGLGPIFVERIQRDVSDPLDHDVTKLSLVDKSKEFLRRDVEVSSRL